MGQKNHQDQLGVENDERNSTSNVHKLNHVVKGSIKIIYTNADSLPNKFTELQAYVNMSSPHIIGVCEVKPKNSRYELNEAEINMQGYNLYSSNLKKGRQRGCALYVSDKLNATLLETTDSLHDQVWVEVKVTGSDTLLIGILYRSPGIINNDNDKMLNSIKYHCNKKKYSHIMIMGDFNFPSIDWNHWSTNSDDPEKQPNKFIECMRDCYLYQHILKPTRARQHNQPHILDLIFSNEETMIENMRHLSPLGKSDHEVLEFDFRCNAERVVKENLHRYCLDRGDYESMRQELKDGWEEIELIESIDGKWEFLKNRIQNAANKYIPKKRVGQKRTGVPLPPEVRALVRKKNTAWVRYMEVKHTNEKDVKFRHYRQISNRVRKLTRKAEQEQENEVAKQSKKNPKKFWQFVGSKSKTRPGIPDLVNQNIENPQEKKMTETNKEKADVLVEYFSSVFTKEDLEDMPDMEEQTDETLNDIIFTVEDINARLKRLNKTKSAGPDELSPRILLELADVIDKPTTHIFRTTLDNGVIPSEWREAKVSAIYKKGKKELPENYRPVSLTCILCKVLEGVIRDQMLKFLRETSLLSNRQYGFISGRSTTLQLVKVFDQWTKILEDGGSLDCIYMDFRKAFDTVPYQRMQTKLTRYGIKGKVHRWISDYLFNRKHQVIVNGESSKWAPVTSGIPQGSVLGPLLFTIYINDLPKETKSPTFLFADDTKLFQRMKDATDQEVLQDDLNKLKAWSDKWQLIFHPEKCKVLEVTRNKREKRNYNLDGVILEHIEEENDLGVLTDSKLTFTNHISNKINKANNIMGIIRRTFKKINKEMFNRLYKPLVRTQLEYANVVWAPHMEKDIRALESVQRRATKQIPGIRDQSYEQRLRYLDLPTLRFRRQRGDLIETYKILTNKYDQLANDIFPLQSEESKTSQITRGHQLKLFPKHHKLKVRKCFFSNRVVNTWNALPEWLINSESVRKFESGLDRLFSTQPMRFDPDVKMINLKLVKRRSRELEANDASK